MQNLFHFSGKRFISEYNVQIIEFNMANTEYFSSQSIRLLIFFELVIRPIVLNLSFIVISYVNPLSANPTKWSNTSKQNSCGKLGNNLVMRADDHERMI